MREAHTFNFGSYALLAGVLEGEGWGQEQDQGRGVSGTSRPGKGHTYNDEPERKGSVNGKDANDEAQKVLEALRE